MVNMNYGLSQMVFQDFAHDVSNRMWNTITFTNAIMDAISDYEDKYDECVFEILEIV